MSARDRQRLSPQEERAGEAVRSLPAPPADAAYRARLKRGFASGTLEPAEARTRPPLPLWRRPRWSYAVAAFAAALLVTSTLNHGPRWELVSVRGGGEAVVDGVAVPLASPDLERKLKPGARLKLPPDGPMEVALPGQLAVQITPGTEVTLPAAAGRWFSRGTRAVVAGGELRITTGADFRGARLAIGTPEAVVEVTGTTLSVICEPAGTCVCVLEGSVTVMARSESAGVPVTEGRRRYVFNDTRPPEMAEIRPGEIGSLQDFRARRQALMKSAAP